MGNDVRRSDVLAGQWVRPSVSAGVTHVPGFDNLAGIASLDARPTEQVMTEQGPIRIGFGPSPHVGYVPSTAALSVVPHLDTRRTGISDRYYR